MSENPEDCLTTPSPTLAISPHIILLFHLNRTWILLCINCHLLIDEGDDYFSWTTSVDPLDIFILIISSLAWNPLMNQSYCLQSKDQYINKIKIWYNLLQLFFPVSTWNGNPLQCSCLENPRDREAWWAAVYGVSQSRTRLKWLSSSSLNLYSFLIWLHFNCFKWALPTDSAASKCLLLLRMFVLPSFHLSNESGELRELVMDREALRAVIHGVSKSRTRLSDCTELNWTELNFSSTIGSQFKCHFLRECFLSFQTRWVYLLQCFIADKLYIFVIILIISFLIYD